MLRNVVLPPKDQPGLDGARAAGWWHQSPQGKIFCDLCPRACAMKEGARGFCFVRQNEGGRLVSTTYGRSTGFCIDPIEKKPLNHFYPGTSVLSFGTAGCNLGCKYCQNWSMSKSREVDSAVASAMPDDIAHTAREMNCRSVAFTYNDPVIWAEYAIDTAQACREQEVKTVAVTNGYITAAARGPFFQSMDAANVDLKAFTEDFYFKLTGGHLAPILDTLRWLVHESDVWLEITNLVIPQANDSDDELKRMCDWIATELRADVPVHFTAFHPDFRMNDRGPTPMATLNRAAQIAREAGLKYVYTGNVSDRKQQSTYCPACGKLLIERDGYRLGEYAIRGDCCAGCGEQIAGRFDASPGDWGPRRMPVRILPSTKPSSATPKGAATMEPEPSPPSERARHVPGRPELTQEQQQRILRAVSGRVAAAVCAAPAQRLDEVLLEIAGMPIFGAFVSLKRSGRLRSCCGFLGHKVALHEALDLAAVRSAKDDPRFPPISPAELAHLDVEVWLLWGMEPMTAMGLDRARAVTIGKHGLQISRGAQRGLLLPGVAVEHNLDAVGFLRQVCIKAGLPVDAWKADDVQLSTFEGYAIRGRLDASQIAVAVVPAVPGPTAADIAALARFCRDNLAAFLLGATPSFYLPGAFDGGVNGVTLRIRIPGNSSPIDRSQFSLRPEMPLQATLLEMARGAAESLRTLRWTESMMLGLDCGLAVFWDPAMHGSAQSPDLAGPASRRAIMVSSASHWGIAFDPALDPQSLLGEAMGHARLRSSAHASVYSMAVASTEPRLATSNAQAAQPASPVRPTAVAGRFYPGTDAEIDRMLSEFLPGEPHRQRWSAAMVPHAGWIYSGKLAAETLSRVEFPSRVIVIAPKHHPGGADMAVAPHRAWAIPGGEVPADPELAQQLVDCVPDLTLDAEAHRAEHAVEVQLPILARLAPSSRITGIVLRDAGYDRLEQMAEQIADVLRRLPERPLLVISTDMNHFADDASTRKVDRLALDAVESLDPRRLFETVMQNRISMCGVLPAVLAMQTLRALGTLNRCEPVGYATSADASGDRTRVVGYAGMLFE